MFEVEKQTFRKLYKHLHKLGKISIPRCLGGFFSLKNVQLHVFADAFSAGICVVCYSICACQMLMIVLCRS